MAKRKRQGLGSSTDQHTSRARDAAGDVIEGAKSVTQNVTAKRCTTAFGALAATIHAHGKVIAHVGAGGASGRAATAANAVERAADVFRRSCIHMNQPTSRR